MKMVQKTKPRHMLTLLCICYLLAHLITSSSTSPLWRHCYGGDSALFVLLGKGVTEGKMLYADLFDHKGPFIFFFNALGYWMGGRTGIFVLQGIFGVISLACIYYGVSSLRNFDRSDAWKCLFLFLCSYIVCFRTFQNGNSTEEYSQPFISCAMLLFIRYAVSAEEKPEHPPLYAFLYGICMAVLALLRLNNAVTVCAGVLAIFLYLIWKKQYRNLMQNLAFGLLGLGVVTLPVCAYFLYHGALYDMIYAAFLYNFKVVSGPSHFSILDEPLKYFSWYLPLLISILLIVSKVWRTKCFDFLDFLLALILACNLLILWLANRYAHYFALYIPVYVVFLFRYLDVNSKRLTTLLVLLCTLLSLGYLGKNTAEVVFYSYYSNFAQLEYEEVQEGSVLIPEDERDSVIGYEIPVAYYLRGDITPCYKYYCWQENWGSINPDVLPDFMEWLKTEKPLWVWTLPGEDNPELLEILSENYQLFFENNSLVMYRLGTN